jgi:hypothetical protein
MSGPIRIKVTPSSKTPLIFPDRSEHGHPVGSGHDLIIMTRWLADHVDDGDPSLIRDEEPSDLLADAIPDASLEREGRRDVDEDGPRIPPAPFVDRRQPGPAGPRQEPALTSAVSPSDNLEPPITPDRQPRFPIAEQELDLALAAPLMGPTVQAMPPDQLRGQFAPCQADSGTHDQ